VPFNHYVLSANLLSRLKEVKCSICGVKLKIGDFIHSKTGKRNPHYCESCYQQNFG
jgi:hypothetical protein